MERPRQILAMGGGGFSMEPENPLLDRYALSLTERRRPRVCFLGTASGDAAEYIEKFTTAFERFDCRLSHLSLFSPPTADLRSLLLEQNLIYVGGGNTKSMLALWREWGLDGVLREAWEQGVVLAGLSAGAICWFEWGTTDSIPGSLTALNCLGLLPGSFCPHYDGEIERRPSFQQMIAGGTIPPGYAADDGVALQFEGTDLVRVVSSRQAARAYRVDLSEGVVVETPLTPMYLGT